MPFLVLGRLFFHAGVDVVQSLGSRIEILYAYGLPFEAVSAVIACAFSTRSLRYLHLVLQVLGLSHLVSAASALAV